MSEKKKLPIKILTAIIFEQLNTFIERRNAAAECLRAQNISTTILDLDIQITYLVNTLVKTERGYCVSDQY